MNTGSDVSSVARLCRQGKLKSRKKDGKWQINRKELEA
jgi:hypothetical protein